MVALTLCVRFTSGNVVSEPGAAVCRLAPTFVRFGTFQLPASRGGDELKLVKELADWVIKYHFPHLEGSHLPLQDVLGCIADHKNSAKAVVQGHQREKCD